MASKDTPFAGGRWTAARYKTFIKTALRQAMLRYPVKQDVKNAARRPAQGRSGRTKWEYQCRSCEFWFLGTEVQVDHIEECGSMDDMNAYIARMFCEEDGMQVLCKGCHKAKKRETA